MSLFLESLQIRTASRLASRSSTSSWICSSCRADLQKKRKLHTRGPSRQGDLAVQDLQVSVFSPSQSTVRYIPAARTPVKDLAQTQQWRDAQRLSMEPLIEVLEIAKQTDADLARVLATGDTLSAISMIVDHKDDPSFWESIPLTTWTELWQAFNPQKLFPAARAYRSSTRTNVVTKYKERRVWYERLLFSLLRLRHRHGQPVDTVDYRILLRYAASVGNLNIARTLWENMKRDGIRPDRECYNRYMEAIVWNEQAKMKQARKSTGTIPLLTPQYTSVVHYHPGASAEVSRLFDEMSAAKIAPDVSTMCILMTALARVGEFKEATKILERVWSVDVEAMLAGDDAPNLSKVYSSSSLLYPTPRLFTTIADIFGLANEVPAGLRVIDFISSQHKLKLKEHVWYQILRWAWTNARIKEHERKAAPGGTQIDSRTVRDILDVMESHYKIEPTMDLYDMSFRTLMQSSYAMDLHFQPEYFMKVLYAGRSIVSATKKKLGQRQYPAHIIDAPNKRKIRRRLRQQALRSHSEWLMQKQTFQHWLHQVCALPRTKLGKRDHTIKARIGPGAFEPDEWAEEGLLNLSDWRLRGFQQFVAQFGRHLPRKLRYTTGTGFVELERWQLAGGAISEAVEHEKQEVARPLLSNKGLPLTSEGTRRFNNKVPLIRSHVAKHT